MEAHEILISTGEFKPRPGPSSRPPVPMGTGGNRPSPANRGNSHQGASSSSAPSFNRGGTASTYPQGSQTGEGTRESSTQSGHPAEGQQVQGSQPTPTPAGDGAHYAGFRQKPVNQSRVRRARGPAPDYGAEENVPPGRIGGYPPGLAHQRVHERYGYPTGQELQGAYQPASAQTQPPAATADSDGASGQAQAIKLTSLSGGGKYMPFAQAGDVSSWMLEATAPTTGEEGVLKEEKKTFYNPHKRKCQDNLKAIFNDR